MNSRKFGVNVFSEVENSFDFGKQYSYLPVLNILDFVLF